MTDPVFEITKAATFDAAHYLPAGGPADGRYTRLHGHSFKVEASVRASALNAEGWVADLGALERVLKDLAAELDHGVLNERPGLENPTLEHLCLHFAEKLKASY